MNAKGQAQAATEGIAYYRQKMTRSAFLAIPEGTDEVRLSLGKVRFLTPLLMAQKALPLTPGTKVFFLEQGYAEEENGMSTVHVRMLEAEIIAE